VLDDDDWEDALDEFAELAKRSPEAVERCRLAAASAGMTPGEWLLEALKYLRGRVARVLAKSWQPARASHPSFGVGPTW
jgi:hypothetical protein